ncbi:MAG: VWA domain-containing protein, partial [Leucobacter sp.]|nr:VWA domain-containing protein [Leucobacter sp.]
MGILLDDSGSMFRDDAGQALDRWSAAKYSVEVFAAMLSADDSLKVFRTSDFANADSAAPAATVHGEMTLSERVAEIHSMPMIGGGTPITALQHAISDLTSSRADEKWLVVLSDGQFDGVPDNQVQQLLESFAALGGAQVNFLAIGDDAPAITASNGIYFDHAPTSASVLSVMTEFSNRIFGRSVLSTTNKASPDIDLDEIVVFAQGASVDIQELKLGDGTAKKPVSSVSVMWADNPNALYAGSPVPATPNTSLQGKLAVFTDVPAGPVTAEVVGANTVAMFYRPSISFGMEIRDQSGALVERDKVEGGNYTVEFGFMDGNCDFVESELFGNPEFSAELIQHPKDDAAGDGAFSQTFMSGEAINLVRGDASLEVRATFANGSSSSATTNFTVLRPGREVVCTSSEEVTFAASRITEYRAPDDALALTCQARGEDGSMVGFTAEEWDVVRSTDDAVSVRAVDAESDVQFRVSFGVPGEVFVLPTAPEGDKYALLTGEVPFDLSISYVYDEQVNQGAAPGVVEIIDDISWFDRFVDWFKKIGWLWLLALVAFIWILGYFVRPKFSRRIKQSPTITFKPKSRGKRVSILGKFEKDRLAALIPYRARTANLTYAQRGFAKMKLRAKRGQKIEIVNWHALAQRSNIRINGEVLD